VSSPARTLIFVYGTLKRGCRNHHFLAGQMYLGEARTIPGFRLFDLGNYPGMIANSSATDQVAGEVWSLDADGLARLDRLEGTDEGLYRREIVALMPPFSEPDRIVQTYLYLRSVEGRAVISGGVWRE
jgi:gamma-glutamylcyclotransferase (GGCT)/AIG2-like uncharacterized protein YtfP